MNSEDRSKLIFKRQDLAGSAQKETQSPEELQMIFEQLLVEYISNDGRPVERPVPFSDATDNGLHQSFFVRPGDNKEDLPDVGLAIISSKVHMLNIEPIFM